MMAHVFAKTVEKLSLATTGETESLNMKNRSAKIQLNERQFMKDIYISVPVVVKSWKHLLRYALLVGMRFVMQNPRLPLENWP